MKKTIVCSMFVVLLLPLAARAQDTVKLQDGWYLRPCQDNFNIFVDPSYAEENQDPLRMFNIQHLFGSMLLPGIGWMVCYNISSSNDSMVYGIALTADNFPHNYEGNDVEPVLELDMVHGDYTLNKLDSINVHDHLTKECYFVYEIETDSGKEKHVVQSIEVYFDTPHSFNSLTGDTISVGLYWTSARIQQYLAWLESTFSPTEINSQSIKVYGALTSNNNCTGAASYNQLCNMLLLHSDYPHGVAFPIVQLRCAAPNPMLLGRETQEATVGWWQAEEGEATQLSLGPYGSDPDSGLLATPADTFHTFTGLQPDCVYSAWVRKACRYTTAGYDTLVWSDWSRPLVFRTKVGIGKVDADTDVRLQPNPARDKVTVSSSFGLLHIEIHDAAGVLVYSEAATGHQKTIGIGSLRSGTYIVTVQTHAGITHKKLAVQR